MTKNKKASKKIEYPELAKAVGHTTFLRLDWKDWKVEQPKSGEEIYVIVKAENGFIPLTGEYWDVTLPASKDGHFKQSRWRSVKFHSLACCELFLDNKLDAKLLIAWAKAKLYGGLLTETKSMI